jgi:hypothetical protein
MNLFNADNNCCVLPNSFKDSIYTDEEDVHKRESMRLKERIFILTLEYVHRDVALHLTLHITSHHVACTSRHIMLHPLSVDGMVSFCFILFHSAPFYFILLYFV